MTVPENTMAAPQPEFVTHCLDLLESVGRCTARRMFGGWGISHQGLTFAIIADLGAGERLYLKTDAQTGPRFEAEGGERFIYTAKGKPMAMGYHTAPEDAMESPALMRPWAHMGWNTAVQAQAAKPPLKPRKSQ
jgi:DNA transformation protein and related proteins